MSTFKIPSQQLLTNRRLDKIWKSLYSFILSVMFNSGETVDTVWSLPVVKVDTKQVLTLVPPNDF